MRYITPEPGDIFLGHAVACSRPEPLNTVSPKLVQVHRSDAIACGHMINFANGRISK
jgi:hypothetical protein